jgi:holo-[acyl-carrier protein] synthase
MILGIGSDVVNIERVEKLLKEFGQKFEQKIFTDKEIAHANARAKAGERIKASTLAKRIAAKEAFVKAVGCGFADGIHWKEIEVSNDDAGKPVITVSGTAEAKLRAIAPHGILPRVDVSLADDYPVALGYVVISFS